MDRPCVWRSGCQAEPKPASRDVSSRSRSGCVFSRTIRKSRYAHQDLLCLPIANLSGARPVCSEALSHPLAPASLSPFLSPEVLESPRRKLGVPHGVLDVLVTEVRLQGPRIMALIRQRKPASMPQHMRVSLEPKPRRLPSPLHKASKPRSSERCPAFAGENKGRLRLLLSLQPSQGPQFISPDWVRARRALLDPTDCQGRGVEIDLIPIADQPVRRLAGHAYTRLRSWSRPGGRTDCPWRLPSGGRPRLP